MVCSPYPNPLIDCDQVYTQERGLTGYVRRSGRAWSVLHVSVNS